jgi:hypothetical protein
MRSNFSRCDVSHERKRCICEMPDRDTRWIAVAEVRDSG